LGNLSHFQCVAHTCLLTEIGWDEIGRDVVAACQRSGQEYRVIAIK
jgi:hypothetical protein